MGETTRKSNPVRYRPRQAFTRKKQEWVKRRVNRILSALDPDMLYPQKAGMGEMARSSNPVHPRPRHALPAKKVNSGSFNDYQESMTLRPQICYYCILVHYYQITEEYSDG